MLRSPALVFWNSLKGGVDVYSRNLKKLDYSEARVSPVVSVVKRIMSSQTNNASTIYFFNQAVQKGIIPSNKEQYSNINSGYAHIRHQVSSLQTFVDFVRALAKEFKAERSAICTDAVDTHHNSKYPRRVSKWVPTGSRVRSVGTVGTVRSEHQAETIRVVNDLKPRFASKKIPNWNKAQLRSFRKTKGHEKVLFNRIYCASCCWYYQFRWKGQLRMTRGGHNRTTW